MDVDDQYHKRVLAEMRKYIDIKKIDDGYLDFEMSGDNEICYGALEEIRDWAIKEKIPMELNTSEYSECEGGFYYDSEE